MSTVKDPFQEALERRQQAAKEAEQKKNQGNFSYDYEERKYFPLVDKMERVFRVIGNPAEARKNPEDAKIVLQSQIVREDRKGYDKINWPYIEKDGKYVPDPSWILTKFYNKLNEGKWQKYADGHIDEKGKNGQFVRYHENTEIYKLIKANAKEGERYPKDFYPSTRVVMNVIDRHDDWCKVNKHTKILTSKLGESQGKDESGNPKTFYFPDTGVPKGVYDKMFEHCLKTGTTSLNSKDFIVIKQAEKKDYEVWDKDDRYITEDSKKIAGTGPLTEEESSYECYNLDKHFDVSSYHRIKKTMGSRIKLCDHELKTNFYDELEQLVQIEAAEWEKQKAEKEASEGSSIKKEETKVETKTAEVEAPKPRSREAAKSVSTENSSIEEQCKTVFGFWNNLSAEDQKNLIEVIDRFENKVTYYKAGIEVLGCNNESCVHPGTTTTFGFPETVTTCPHCGTKG